MKRLTEMWGVWDREQQDFVSFSGVACWESQQDARLFIARWMDANDIHTTWKQLWMRLRLVNMKETDPQELGRRTTFIEGDRVKPSSPESTIGLGTVQSNPWVLVKFDSGDIGTVDATELVLAEKLTSRLFTLWGCYDETQGVFVPIRGRTSWESKDEAEKWLAEYGTFANSSNRYTIVELARYTQMANGDEAVRGISGFCVGDEVRLSVSAHKVTSTNDVGTIQCYDAARKSFWVKFSFTGSWFGWFKPEELILVRKKAVIRSAGSSYISKNKNTYS